MPTTDEDIKYEYSVGMRDPNDDSKITRLAMSPTMTEDGAHYLVNVWNKSAGDDFVAIRRAISPWEVMRT